MPVEDYSDDYVAQLLAKDAKTSAKNYSSLGLQAFLPKRPTHNAPKPNTRFLKNIIKETDNHNAALKVKEEQEAHARLRKLGRNDESPKKTLKGTRERETEGHRPKKRKLDEINGILSGRSRTKKILEAEVTSRYDSRRDRETRHYSDDESLEERSRARQSHSYRHRHSHRHRSGSREEKRQERTSHHKRVRRRSRSRSPQLQRKDDYHHRRSRHARNRSPSSTDSREERNIKSNQTARRYKANRPDTHPKSIKDDVGNEGDDSDPLESLGLIGPAPPPPPPKIKSRGRGAFASTAASTIDHHFKTNYDPTIDIAPDVVEVEDDWDQALEALKDRQQWQQNQAERLRVAGFSEVEIAKWEKGKNGGEGEVDDVRWTEKGEGREWDRGKVVDEEGDVETGNVEWGRLKGT